MIHEPTSWWYEDVHLGACFKGAFSFCLLARVFVATCTCGDAVSVRVHLDSERELDALQVQSVMAYERRGREHFGRNVIRELEGLENDSDKNQPAHR